MVDRMINMEDMMKRLVWPIGLLTISVSIFDVVFPGLLPNGWYVVAIFCLLFSVAVPVTDIRERIEKIELASHRAGFSKYRNTREFYQALENAMKNAKHELLLTHIRLDPPAKFTEGEEYYGLVEKWATDHPEGVVKRISTNTPEKMKEWASQQQVRAKRQSNYYFRVIEWSNQFSHINMAIIDEKTVYIAISGDTAEETSGLETSDSEIVGNFKKYFNIMWSHATRLD